MRLTPTSINGSVLNNALAKMAARKVLASFSVPPETDWKKVKPLFAEALARASVEGIVEAEDIYNVFQKLSATGVRIGDGTNATIRKEAQNWKNWLGKATEWVGNLGEKAKEKGKQWQEQGQQKIEEQKQATEFKAINKGLQETDDAVISLANAIRNLPTVDPYWGRIAYQSILSALPGINNVRSITQVSVTPFQKQPAMQPYIEKARQQKTQPQTPAPAPAITPSTSTQPATPTPAPADELALNPREELALNPR